MKHFAALFLILFLASCSDSTPRIDASSDEAFESSMEKVAESIADPKAKEDFLGTVALVAMGEMNLGEDDPDGKKLNARLAKKFDGMSADEILEKYKDEVSGAQEQGAKAALEAITPIPPLEP